MKLQIGVGNGTFTIPTIDWGDGTVESYNTDANISDGQTINNVTGDYTITFPSPGIYDIYD